MKPPFLNAIDFTDEEFAKVGLLLELRIHVTEKCNLKCIYCLSNAPFMEEKHIDRLTIEEIKSSIIQAKKLGAKVVSITGSGEPLLYGIDRLKMLIKFIKSNNMEVILFTNALALTKEFAKFLYNNNVNLMVKLNSLKSWTNDEIVGVKGSHRIFIEKINMLLKMGFGKGHMLALNCVILPQNYEEIEGIFLFCRKKNIIPWIETVTITGRANGTLEIPKEKIILLYQKLSEIDKALFGYEWAPDSPIIGADRRRYKYVCQIGLNGNLYHTDAKIIDSIGNIRNNSIHELITSKGFIDLRDSDKHSCSINQQICMLIKNGN